MSKAKKSNFDVATGNTAVVDQPAGGNGDGGNGKQIAKKEVKVLHHTKRLHVAEMEDGQFVIRWSGGGVQVKQISMFGTQWFQFRSQCVMIDSAIEGNGVIEKSEDTADVATV
jgi:hypothetical protein